EEGAHGKSPKCLGGNLGDFGEFCKGLKPSEGDVFEPVESRQQAKCARCRLKGDRMPDYRVSGED
ncbi:TPA: hypothetical protein ACJKDL_000710, partial [Neisseria meningitidis]